MKTALIRSKDETAKALLHESGQLLFLPSGSEDLKDSEFEPYLDCPLPESAIYLANGGNAQVAICDGGDMVPLLENRATGLTFAPSARNRVPVQVQRILQQSFEAFEGYPNRRCGIEFLEWLYRYRPARIVTVLEYFLTHPHSWLIGLPTETASMHLFSEPPIPQGYDGVNQWYQLRHIELNQPRPRLEIHSL